MKTVSAKTIPGNPRWSLVDATDLTLGRLASDNGVELVELQPTAGKTYPGITELKYTIQSRSTFEDLVGFLADFEKADFWADVTQLSIGHRGATGGAPTRHLPAQFVVSLFASRSPSDDKTPVP